MSNCPDLFMVCIFWFVLILKLQFHTSSSKLIEECDIASKLFDANIDDNLAHILICIAEKLSGLNTSALNQKSIIPDSCKTQHGLFQIGSEWCQSDFGDNMNCSRTENCQMDCSKLLDKDIADDIKCTKIIRLHLGLMYWPNDVVASCRMEAEINHQFILNCRNKRRSLLDVPLWGALLMVCVACLLVFLCTYYWYWHRQSSVTLLSTPEVKYFKHGRKYNSSNSSNFQEVIQNLRDFTDEPYNKKFEVLPSQYTIDHNVCLGSGAYGVVYKATCKGKEVAAKTLKPNATKEYLQSLLGELKILSIIESNEFIVNLIGAHTQQIRQGILFIFMEYCPLGNLEKYLRTNKHIFITIAPGNKADLAHYDPENFTTKNLYQYSHQIAKGMMFLEQKRIIHSDLAARNVLLVDAHTAKLSDFGLSRKLYDYSQYIKTKEEPLPWRHMALESLRENAFSTQSDVWMFGVLLFEIFSLGSVPYPGMTWTMDFVNKLEAGFRMTQPTYASIFIYNIMLDCWKTNPSERPSFSELVSHLSNALCETGWDYVEVISEDTHSYDNDQNETSQANISHVS